MNTILKSIKKNLSKKKSEKARKIKKTSTRENCKIEQLSTSQKFKREKFMKTSRGLLHGQRLLKPFFFSNGASSADIIFGELLNWMSD